MKISVDVQYSGGNVDIAATTLALTTKLETLEAERSAALSAVAPHVEAYFDAQASDFRSTLPSVSGCVAAQMKAGPEKWVQVCEDVADYIRSNANGKGNDTFVIGRGRNQGGVSRKQ